MKRDDRISGLRRITQLVMDQHLADLRAKRTAQTETRMLIAGLDQHDTAEDMPFATASLVGLRYAAWATQRRRALNVTLAQQTVAVLDAEDAARTAFARDSVMAKLADAAQKGSKPG